MCIGIPRDHSLNSAAASISNVERGNREFLDMALRLQILLKQSLDLDLWVSHSSNCLQRYDNTKDVITQIVLCTEIFTQNPIDSNAFYQEIAKTEAAMAHILFSKHSHPVGLHV
jgi:hypothetical protein